jgi:hypothetical protein
MAKAQFARAQAYSTSTLDAVLSEADREPGFTAHIPAVKPPVWRMGSKQAVDNAIVKYMSEPAPVRLKSGKLAYRKRRKDHRCLTAGVLSWPDPTADFSSGNPLLKIKFQSWLDKTQKWLDKQYGENLVAVCLHTDESHPHIHFFVVGDAQRLHPGLRAELINDNRIVDPAARMLAHKSGLKSWLDDYQDSVGQHYGMERTLNARPAWRIQDRATREKLFQIDKQLKALPNADIEAQRNQVWDEEYKTDRPEMRF